MPVIRSRSRALRNSLPALSLLFATAAAAQRAASSAPVVPGLTVTVSASPAPDTVVYGRSVTKNGQDSISGTRTVVRRVVSTSTGERTLEVEQRFPARGGEIVDTAVAELRTMRAMAHQSHQPTKVMRFQFVADSAIGTVTAVGATTAGAPTDVLVHQSIGGPIFDSNVLELVIAGLPLAPNFSVDLPFFIYERGGRVMMPAKVVERTRVSFPLLGERDVWVVSLGVPGAPATLWIDTATRAVLRVRFEIASNSTSFTDDRMTPLRPQ